MNKSIISLILTVIFVTLPASGQNQKSSSDVRYKNLQSAGWQEVFFDDGTSSWQEKWFLDGERGNVRNTPEGMVFSAGPVRGDNGSHSVLWTRDVFKGDIKIEFDYTRLDDVDYGVNILYIQATGIGRSPYSENIADWSRLRLIPYMSIYYQYMNLLHISYAANMPGGSQNDYVRARRYPVKPGEDFETTTRVFPDYDNTGLFLPGITYHFTFIKKGYDLFFNVMNENTDRLFYWNTSVFDPVTKGRIGIRHMYTRAARYYNIHIFLLK